ncbi:hypothetical protein ACWDZ8_06920 [Streptomyces sp. NPDC003233]
MVSPILSFQHRTSTYPHAPKSLAHTPKAPAPALAPVLHSPAQQA